MFPPIIKATQSAEWTTDQGANKKQYYGNTPTVRDQLSTAPCRYSQRDFKLQGSRFTPTSWRVGLQTFVFVNFHGRPQKYVKLQKLPTPEGQVRTKPVETFELQLYCFLNFNLKHWGNWFVLNYKMKATAALTFWEIKLVIKASSILSTDNEDPKKGRKNRGTVMDLIFFIGHWCNYLWGFLFRKSKW